jgi:hypothetical protein
MGQVWRKEVGPEKRRKREEGMGRRELGWAAPDGKKKARRMEGLG